MNNTEIREFVNCLKQQGLSSVEIQQQVLAKITQAEQPTETVAEQPTETVAEIPTFGSRHDMIAWLESTYGKSIVNEFCIAEFVSLSRGEDIKDQSLLESLLESVLHAHAQGKVIDYDESTLKFKFGWHRDYYIKCRYGEDRLKEILQEEADAKSRAIQQKSSDRKTQKSQKPTQQLDDMYGEQPIQPKPKQSQVVTDIDVRKSIVDIDESTQDVMSIDKDTGILSAIIPYCKTFGTDHKSRTRFKSKRFLIIFNVDKTRNVYSRDVYDNMYRNMYDHFDSLRRQRKNDLYKLKSFMIAWNKLPDSVNQSYVYVEFENELHCCNDKWLPNIDADGDVIVLKPNTAFTSKTAIIRVLRQVHNEYYKFKPLEYGLKGISNARSKAEELALKYNNAYEAILSGNIKNAQSASVIMDMKNALEDNDCVNVPESYNLPLFKWQEQLLEILEREPDDRSLHWCWELYGKVGKSYFAKMLRDVYNAKLFTASKAHDLEHILCQLSKSDWSGEIIVIDLTRANDSWKGLYSFIELVKNANGTSGKFKSQNWAFNRHLHVVVFANWPPAFSNLSADRTVNICPMKPDGTFDETCILPDGSVDPSRILRTAFYIESTRKYEVDRQTGSVNITVNHGELIRCSMSYDDYIAAQTRRQVANGRMTIDDIEPYMHRHNLISEE